jgi:hypothetical protein
MRSEFLAGAATLTALILRSLQARQRRQVSKDGHEHWPRIILSL